MLIFYGIPPVCKYVTIHEWLRMSAFWDGELFILCSYLTLRARCNQMDNKITNTWNSARNRMKCEIFTMKETISWKIQLISHYFDGTFEVYFQRRLRTGFVACGICTSKKIGRTFFKSYVKKGCSIGVSNFSKVHFENCNVAMLSKSVIYYWALDLSAIRRSNADSAS